jgi:single-stranded-DNA-specific exonuclease
LLDSLALVALGSVADCAPLINNNRILVHHGLKALERTTLPGLKALLQSCDLWGQPLTANDVSWKLSPLLNAAGRLGEADHTIELLCATDDASAKKLANQLHKDNEQRRRLTSVLADDLKSQVSAMQELPEGLVFAGEGWHPGVIGIAAARICEDHQRPTAVIAVNDGIGRGSLRAPPGLRLDQALDDCRDLLISGGGHAAAAGLSISIDNIPLFSERFAAAIASQQPDGAQASPLVYDCRAAIGDLNGDFFADLQRLGPFGHGNPEPTLLIERACINGKPNCFGKKGDHLRAALTDPHGGMRQLLAWNLGERLNAFLQPNAAFDLIVRPERNWYRGELYPQLVLVDGRLQ